METFLSNKLNNRGFFSKIFGNPLDKCVEYKTYVFKTLDEDKYLVGKESDSSI
jgi:hypothetical protein